jgi:hypothetical protein
MKCVFEVNNFSTPLLTAKVSSESSSWPGLNFGESGLRENVTGSFIV